MTRLAMALFVGMALPGLSVSAAEPESRKPAASVFQRDNLVAWCVVPFDAAQRGPEARAEMLNRLGIRRLAYDWRSRHIPQFEQEITTLKRHGIEFFAFWSVHDEAFRLFEKHDITPQVWVTLRSPKAQTQAARVEAAGRAMLPLVERTRRLGCRLGLYNHGGWGGKPSSLIAVVHWLRQHAKADHVGIVYNLHHAHHDLDELADRLGEMAPLLHCLNLNGTTVGGPKILPIGQGKEDARLLAMIRRSAYRGPIGVLDHVGNVDAEVQLRKNLVGLKNLLIEIGDVDAAKTFD